MPDYSDEESDDSKFDEIDGNAIIIDNGSGFLKAGFGSSDCPELMFPSIPPPKKVYGRYRAASWNGQSFDASQLRQGPIGRHPIERGIIRRWDDMEALWKNTFKKLGTTSTEHPLLITESALTPNADKERVAQIMMETFGVPKYYVSLDAVLSLYASGRATGTVLSSGYGITTICPIYEAYRLPHGISKLDVAGNDVSEYLHKLLLQKENVYPLDLSSVHDIKEKMCFVSADFELEMKNAEERKETKYKLPDGRQILIGDEVFKATEAMFTPRLCKSGLINSAYDKDRWKGVHQILHESIMKCDGDIREELLGNIVMSGGGTMYEGFKERFSAEMKQIVSNDVEIKVVAPPERMQSVWIGGSILSRLHNFEQMWITQDEYNEDGPAIVHRKCP